MPPIYEYTDDPLYVSEGDYVQFRFIAPNDWNKQTTVTIMVGDLPQYWLITTVPEDFTPDPFPFQNISEAELSTMYVSDVIFISDLITDNPLTGLTPGTEAPVVLGSNIGNTIADYSLRIDREETAPGWDTGWIHSSGTVTVSNGDKIQVRQKSSSFYTQYANLTLVIGTSSEQWQILTIALPTNEPNPFPIFTDLEDQPTNTYIYSEIVRIQGLTTTATINTSGSGEWAVASANNTTTNENGFGVLNGATFTTSNGDVSNGDYLQLRILSSALPITLTDTSLSIGDAINGATWSVRTGQNPSTNPNPFSFVNIPDAEPDTFIASDRKPVGGIGGLTAGISVPVELLSTSSSLVRVKKNDDSVGVFPTTVENGDELTLYLQSSTLYDTPETLQIKVGDRTIPTWIVRTNLGPDTDADWNNPANKNNQVPGSFVSSSPIAVTGINRPITIESVSGYPALISIDFDTPILGPRTFDPSINTSFYIVIKAADQLSTPEVTTIQLGTGTPNGFIWQVTTYASVPPPATDAAIWYSRKTNKFDGYSIGTVLPVLKESVGSYGDLDGGVNDRYPGFVPCDGRLLNKNDYFELYTILGGEYGESSNEFRVPDYRNRRLCGIGQVDGNKGNSAQVPIAPGSSKGIRDPGAEGGYWYFDRIGPRGSQPLEQVQGVTSATGSLDSDFFSLGTVRLTGLETLTTPVIFTVSPASFVTAQISKLNSITVAAPSHNHSYISAVVESDGAEASIPWDQPLGRAMFGTGTGKLDGPNEYDATTGGDDEDLTSGENAERIRQVWNTYFSSTLGSLFVLELTRYYGSDFDLDDFIDEFPTNFPYNQEFVLDVGADLSEPFGATEFGPEEDDLEFEKQFITWWISPASALTGANLFRVEPPLAGFTNRIHAGVFDTQPSNFQINNYLSIAPGNQTRTHCHLITENPVGNPNADFTGGPFNDSGSNVSPYGSGLGGGVDGSLLTFSLRNSAAYLESGAIEGRYVPSRTGEWAYRNGGAGFWSGPTDGIQRDEDMIVGTGTASGTGMRLRITYEAWPTGGGGSSSNDTRFRIDQILNSGSGYSVGDILTTQYWNDIPGTANRLLRVDAISDAGTGGAAENISINFTQSDVFMDMTNGTFKYSSSFKRPTPDVEMRPQRQVPIINPFQKTKYIIKAY